MEHISTIIARVCPPLEPHCKSRQAMGLSLKTRAHTLPKKQRVSTMMLRTNTRKLWERYKGKRVSSLEIEEQSPDLLPRRKRDRFIAIYSAIDELSEAGYADYLGLVRQKRHFRALWYILTEGDREKVLCFECAKKRAQGEQEENKRDLRERESGSS